MTTHPILPPLRGPAASLLCGLLLGAAPLTLSAQDTANLPVHVSADSAQMDDRQGIGTYTGNVVVQRGNMTLYADRITIHAPERRLERMVAEGNPVRAESPDMNNQPRVATGMRMEYRFADETLLLLRNARVQTATEDARGDRITYDLAQDIIRIEGTPGERVQITIQPRPE